MAGKGRWGEKAMGFNNGLWVALWKGMENGRHVCGGRKTHLHGFQGMLGAVKKRIKCAGGSVLCVCVFSKKKYKMCKRRRSTEQKAAAAAMQAKHTDYCH
jgi:hypothetical protein